MKKSPNLTLALLLAISLFLGAVQGSRLEDLSEAEAFYRWMRSASNQIRLRGNLDFPTNEDDLEMMDGELFAQVVALTEDEFGEMPPDGAEDVDKEGVPYPKIVRLVRDGGNEDLIWDVSRMSKMAALREDFLKFRGERRLANVSVGIDVSDIYHAEGVSANVFNVFFGFRKVAANFLWLQVDKYWHQGMMHRMIPLMKSCVSLDPHFVDAYMIGAWHLAYNATAQLADTPEKLKVYSKKYKKRLGPKETYYEMGIEFLQDGIYKNTSNYKLYFDLGFGIYEQKLKDHESAVTYLSEAVKYKHDRWVPRMLYMSMQKNGQYEEAIEGWKDYLKRFPDNVNVPRLIHFTEGLIEERGYEKYKALAAASTGKEAADALDMSELHFTQASDIWQEFADGAYGGDPIAYARGLRLKALAYIEQERYHEAVALLEQARWQAPVTFEEMSEIIIKIKQTAGMTLSRSEKHKIERDRDDEEFLKMQRESQ